MNDNKHLLWSIVRTTIAIGVAAALTFLAANVSQIVNAFISNPTQAAVVVSVLTLLVRGAITALRGTAGEGKQ